MGKYAGFAHVHDLSQCTNAQTPQPNLGRQSQCGVHDSGLGLLAFLDSSPVRPSQPAVAGQVGKTGFGRWRSG